MDTALQVLFAGGLAACSGLRAFSTLLMVCWVAQHGNIEQKFLNPDLYPLIAKNETFFQVMVLLTIIEIVGDKLPSYSHFLDALHLILRPLTGAVTALSILNTGDVVLNYILAAALGAVLTLPIQSYRSSCRILTEAGDSGKYNLTLSVTEDTLAIGGTLLTMLKPNFSLFVIIPVFYLILTAFRKWRPRVIAGDDYKGYLQMQSRERDDGEILEIQRLKRMKRNQRSDRSE
ncbi:MAG: DUF4126 domain-containing protein [Firmicutes bacterium]|nr:DUF4126 domain-containing protein [Bacillota bacterium]